MCALPKYLSAQIQGSTVRRTQSTGPFFRAPVDGRPLFKANISSEQALLLEPMSCAHYLIDRIGVKDRSVLVTGCGPVGLLCIGIAKAYEAKSIIAVDIKASSLVLAKTMGRVDHVV